MEQAVSRRDDQWDSWIDSEREQQPRTTRRVPLDERGTVRVQVEKLPPAPTDEDWLDVLRKAGLL